MICQTFQFGPRGQKLFFKNLATFLVELLKEIGENILKVLIWPPKSCLTFEVKSQRLTSIRRMPVPVFMKKSREVQKIKAFIANISLLILLKMSYRGAVLLIRKGDTILICITFYN